MQARRSEPRVFILLSTFNGEAFLRAQLDSFLVQSHENWVLYWRDDGSTDASIPIMHAFSAAAGQGRCVRLATPARRVGPTTSFLLLLREVAGRLAAGDAVAFADQDDVWLPEKLARGLAALRDHPPRLPVLYCARQVLVDARLRWLGLSASEARPSGFPASLTQNVATGCTVMLNQPAAALVAGSRHAPATLHDWWCYLVVTAAGGVVVRDNEPVVLYRQHAGNLVGARRSMLRRGVGALRRGPGVFMAVLRQHIAALASQPDLLSDTARCSLGAIDTALRGGMIRRLAVLRMPGLTRQTWAETLLFRCWFLIG